MKKITVVGGGNAGCFSSLILVQFFRWNNSPEYPVDIEVELIHNPNVGPEPIGQATLVDAPETLSTVTDWNWYNNDIYATPKTGILYKDWGKVNEKMFHTFPANTIAMHFCPSTLQNKILNSNYFKVIEDDVTDLSKIDSDYIFDCRGKPSDFTNYKKLVNPINACILGKPNWNTSEQIWSDHIATPDGWTFVIPTKENSPSRNGSVGYLYNKDITPKDQAEKNFLEMFDVDITKHLNFNNYVAKDLIIDDRIFLNGNRLYFLEPMESSSLFTHNYTTRWYQSILLQVINKKIDKRECDNRFDEAKESLKIFIKEIQDFILWHYLFGSKYDTPFWNYAKKLSNEKLTGDRNYNMLFNFIKTSGWKTIHQSEGEGESNYAYWNNSSLKCWYQAMTEPNFNGYLTPPLGLTYD
jgi:hypothetical protein